MRTILRALLVAALALAPATLARERSFYCGAGTETPTYYTQGVGQGYYAGLVEVDGVLYADGGAQIANGTAAAPSLRLAGSPTTGLYRAAADELGIAIAGVYGAKFTASGLNVVGVIAPTVGQTYPDGEVAAPAWSYTAEPTSGNYRAGAGDLRTAILGVDRFKLTATGVNATALGATTPSTVAATTLSASGATNLNGTIGLGDTSGDAVTLTGTPIVATSSPTLYRTTVVVPVNGKGTTAIWAGDDHPPCRVVGVIFMLTEVPDASATTYTMKISDGVNDICANKTFTQGTDTVGKVLAGSIDTDYDNLAVADPLSLVVGGTTSTLGRGVAYVDVVGE